MAGPSVSHLHRALGMLAVTAVLVACGDGKTSPPPPSVADPPAESTTSTSAEGTTSTSTPSPAPTEAPPSTAPWVAIDVHIDLGTLWRDVFDAFTAAEQACVRDQLDDQLLESALDKAVFPISPPRTTELEAPFSSCLAPKTVRAVFLSFMIAGIEVVVVELGEGDRDCLHDWVSSAEVDTMLSTMVNPDNSYLQFTWGVMFDCVPATYISWRVRVAGAEMGDLSVEEMACLRERVDNVDWTALFDPTLPETDHHATMDEFEDGFNKCAPDLFGMNLSDALGVLAADITIGQTVEGVLEREGQADVFVFEAEEGQAYEIDVSLGTLANSMAELYDGSRKLFLTRSYDSSSGSNMVWVAQNSGWHYIAVSGSSAGSYTLALIVSDVVDDHSNRVEGATSVEVGRSMEGVLDYRDDVDVFVFQAEESVVYGIYVDYRRLHDLTLNLYDEHLAWLPLSDSCEDTPGPEQDWCVVWKAPGSGTHYIAVAGSFGDNGSYALTVEVFEGDGAREESGVGQRALPQ